MDVQIIADKLNEMGAEKVSIKGSDVMCCCPFHPDKSPSFGVHPENGANCFSCLVRFSSADKMFQALAKKTGKEYIPLYKDIPDDYDFLPEIEIPPEPLNENVLRFYKEDPEYFEKNWKVSHEVSRKRHLCIDPYTSAECFPIIDVMGDYWGCIERYPATGRSRSRYHYPDNLPRKNILFGEDRLFNGGRVWLVEGVRDLCAVETKTGETAVAIGSAKISENQLDKLRECGNIVLALDNDKAGRRGRDYILGKLPLGRVYIAKYRGKDPMEAQEFDVVKASLHYLNFD